MQAAAEFRAQAESDPELASVKHVVFATGSGGTAAGLAIGISLAWARAGEEPPKLYAVGVCDTPDYFYKFQGAILAEMGFFESADEAEAHLRRVLVIMNGRGRGYAVSTDAECEFISAYAKRSGLFLDSVRAHPTPSTLDAPLTPPPRFRSRAGLHRQGPLQVLQRGRGGARGGRGGRGRHVLAHWRRDRGLRGAAARGRVREAAEVGALINELA